MLGCRIYSLSARMMKQKMWPQAGFSLSMESRELNIVRWSLVTALQVLVDLDFALRFFVGFFSLVGIS